MMVNRVEDVASFDGGKLVTEQASSPHWPVRRTDASVSSDEAPWLDKAEVLSVESVMVEAYARTDMAGLVAAQRAGERLFR